MNTPINAIGKGVATLAADLGGGWGKVVIVKHEVYGWEYLRPSTFIRDNLA